MGRLEVLGQSYANKQIFSNSLSWKFFSDIGFNILLHIKNKRNWIRRDHDWNRLFLRLVYPAEILFLFATIFTNLENHLICSPNSHSSTYWYYAFFHWLCNFGVMSFLGDRISLWIFFIRFLLPFCDDEWRQLDPHSQ